jgi:acyl-CoA thioester hydrolase
MDLSLIKARKDASRWTIRHQLIKNEKDIAAIITVDGAWMDTVRRKLGTPPPEFAHSFLEMPRAEGFEWV